jgi:hypothetical protein
MTTRRPHAKALNRLLAGLCVLGLLSVDVVGAIHLLTVRHVVCLAHGELLEVAEVTHLRSEEGRGEQQVASEARDAAHEHCAVSVLASRSHAAAVVASSATPAPAELPVILPRSVLGAPRRVAPLAYAPKQGPPA